MKKLSTFLVAMAICLAQTAISQEITLRFTGATAGGNYVQLDSVKVQNVSHSWSETIIYPDTVLAFTNVGIAEAQGLAAELAAYPNPFNGTTNVAVTLLQSGNALLQLFNLAGQKVAERTFELQDGNSIFEVSLQNPQVYLLAVTTPQGRRTIKLLNRKAGEGNGIYFRGIGNVMDKRQSAQIFHTGDELVIVGYARKSGLLNASRYICRTQSENENFSLVFDSVHTGALSGVFSVGENRVVRFSKGNLQYTNNGTHAVADGIAKGTWRFAPNQWDVIGANNIHISSRYVGWIDLFGWGTSGWNSGANAYLPYSTSNSDGDYCPGGSSSNNLTVAYANADWGVYNAIENGGCQPGLWRTLSRQEWDTLINHRNTTSGIRYAMGKVNNVPGLIIVPDDWSDTIFRLNSTNDSTASALSNVIASNRWPVLENAGCVFLPTGGFRMGSEAFNYGSDGRYWSVTIHDIDMNKAYYLSFGNTLYANYFSNRSHGHSVRLVQDE